MDLWVWIVLGYLLVGGASLLWLVSRDAFDWFALELPLGPLAVFLCWPILLMFGLAQLTLCRYEPSPPESPRSRSNLEGQHGVAVSDLRPWGKVHVGDRRYEARAEDGFVSAGQRVEVVGQGEKGLVVRSRPV